MPYSEFQENIFKFVEASKGNAIVEAVAGSGKTTTIVECAKRIPSRLSSTFLAFNKSIAEELKSRLPQHVKAMTLNSMGFSAYIRHVGGNLRLDSYKTRSIAREELNSWQYRTFGQGVVKLVALAKSVGLVPGYIVTHMGATALTADRDDEWQALIDHYDIDFEEAEDTIAIDLARNVLQRSIEIAQEKRLLDFDDQLYLPVILGARFWQYDWMFVDEAQDVNKIQRAMLKASLRPGGHIIAVGDPQQAIYGFRGADSNAIANLKAEFDCVTLPLSISYRCPRSVVQEAQRFVSHIQSSPSAKEGQVSWLELYDHNVFQPQDGVLCRNTAPLVQLAYALLRRRVPCRILGREMSQGLVNLVKRLNPKTIDQLVVKLDQYFEREQSKFLAKGQEEKADALADKVETLHVFITELNEEERTVPGLVRSIETLFSDQGSGILTLCTIHKAKGLEWDRVFILNPELMPSKYARQAWQKAQEVNLQYVAVTRAKDTLFYCNLDGLKEVQQGAETSHALCP